ncbi:hypothetical protein BD309DRAFT_1020133 [Dichomitus squalens]|nr:hypothetical protein BD309DRAFT_1020133 [Dichomitus squalens]
MAGEHSIYLASYDNAPRSNQDARFHWALLIAPKGAGTDSVMTTRMYHATKKGDHWTFEHRRVDSVRSPLMLGRIHFADIDEDRLGDVGRALSDPSLLRLQEEDWDCGMWARDAIAALGRRGWLRAKRWSVAERDLDGLFKFAEQFSEKLAHGRTPVGFNKLPPTKTYTGSRHMLNYLLKL